MVAECRKVPHVKNALFEYTKHEVRAFLCYVRNAHGLEEGADITFGVLSKAIEAEHDYRIEQLQEAQVMPLSLTLTLTLTLTHSQEEP